MLLAPSANRVYTQSSAALAVAELKAFGVIASITELGGQSYLEFDGDPSRLGNLSSAYAFFEKHGELLKPIEVSTLDKYDDDLLTIQKYAGKTNEHFTKLLLNVTALASDRDFHTHRFVVLDPVAGRGTTLNQALMYGWDAIGIEIDRKEVDAYEAFVKTYLRRKRIKHTADMTPVRREGKRLGRRFDAMVDGVINGSQRLTMFEADTTRARQLMKANSVDLIVGDLPYGIVHNARDLLKSALPQWVELLRRGGALGVSWNTHHAPREQAVTLLEAHDLEVLDDAGFAHRVDQGIMRDIVLARKPRG